MNLDTERTARSGRGLRALFRRIRETDAGQALVEFALVLPVMLLMLFALVDFGRGFYSWLIVTNAAREGARVGATQKPLTDIQQRITDSASGIDTSDLTITVTNVQGPRGQPIVVDLSYDFTFVTPIGNILNLMSGGTLNAPTITSTASMRLE
ncbi:MAG: pilus assembly protein [Thermoflexaceae bacterium]|nr:pilus assembly protein [Thermoflexaceae bacterium]